VPRLLRPDGVQRLVGMPDPRKACEAMSVIIVKLGVKPEEPCPDWHRLESSVTDEHGREIGFIDKNDGQSVTIILTETVEASR